MTPTISPFADPLWHSRQSSPYYNDSHRKLQKEARKYVDTHIAPFCEQWEKDGKVPTEVTVSYRKIYRHWSLCLF